MFIECSTQLTISDLNDVETKLGFNLPQQLKEHLMVGFQLNLVIMRKTLTLVRKLPSFLQ